MSELAADLGDGCEREVELIGSADDVSTVVTEFGTGELGGVAWKTAIDANGVESQSASHHMAYADNILSVMQISSFGALNDGEVSSLFSLAASRDPQE